MVKIFVAVLGFIFTSSVWANSACVGGVSGKAAKKHSNSYFDKKNAEIDEFPNFSRFKDEDIVPAILVELAEQRREIQKITENPEPPSFENTILALERVGEKDSWAVPTLILKKSNFSSEAIMKAYQEAMSAYTDFRMELTDNQSLFGRIKSVYDKRGELGLEPDQILLVESQYFEFADGGIHLSPKQRKEYNRLSKKLNEAQARFANNLHTYNKNNFVAGKDLRDLEGVPKDYIDQFMAEAEKRDLSGYYISAGSQIAHMVLQHGRNRKLREKVWRMLVGVGYKGRPNNRQLTWQIPELKHQLAQLLGFENYSAQALKDSMAGSVQAVEEIVHDLIQRVIPVVRQMRTELIEYIKEKEKVRKPMPWDISYWMRVYDQERFSFDEAAFRDYFTLDQVFPKFVSFVERLLRLEMTPRPDLKGLSEDSFVYEVRRNGERLGYILWDMYARDDKDGGASHYSMRAGQVRDGQRLTAISAIQANLNKPLPGHPTKMTLSDLKTLFHEFGHALHSILSSVRYESQSGTSVARDFVELPSQFMENFLLEAEILQSLSAHYQTGEPIPRELIESAYRSRKHKAGFRYLNELQSIQLDFAFYKEPIGKVEDLFEFEKAVSADTTLSRPVRSRMALSSPHFTHIFMGGYSSFYYSYLWSKILDADAFAQFKREGLFNPNVADRWVDKVLSVGGSVKEQDAFVSFMGRKPDIRSLLIRDGLMPEADTSDRP
ncbi:MAG: M3 family metallopeptidase [Bdellovibrionales bacterium]|nr:M3 family metallopeptidase [Bdellovibrionales bacterium]